MGRDVQQRANHEIAERVTPLGQVREALEYYCSGVVTEQRLRLFHRDYAVSPVYFLLGHSIELSLKSLLRKSGMAPEEYRKRHIGHDLCSCLRHAEIKSVAISEALTAADRSELSLLNKQYSSKGFEYFGNGLIEIPMFEPARRLAHVILTVALKEIPLAEGLVRGQLREIFEFAQGPGFNITSSSNA
jgi:hypothetical protein